MRIELFSQNFSRNPSTSFRIRQSMVMILQPIAAKFGYVMKLMINGMWKSSLRSPIRAMKFIVGIVHLITTEDSFQAAFIKRLVMGNQWKPFYHRCYPRPHLRKDGCIFRISLGKAMHFRVPIAIVVRLRLDEGVERIYYLSITDNHHSHTTYTGPFVVGGFKIYGCKVFHLLLWLV